MTTCPFPPARPGRRLPLLLAAALAAAGFLSSPARAESPDDDVSDRLGLSAANETGGALFGLVHSDRLTHTRGLAFGLATSSGSAPYRAASYSDYFSYRFSERMKFDMALEYRMDSESRSLTGDSGRFSVLPSFSLEYHPSDATLVRLAYESYSPFGHRSSWRSPFRPY